MEFLCHSKKIPNWNFESNFEPFLYFRKNHMCISSRRQNADFGGNIFFFWKFSKRRQCFAVLQCLQCIAWKDHWESGVWDCWGNSSVAEGTTNSLWRVTLNVSRQTSIDRHATDMIFTLFVENRKWSTIVLSDDHVIYGTTPHTTSCYLVPYTSFIAHGLSKDRRSRVSLVLLPWNLISVWNIGIHTRTLRDGNKEHETRQFLYWVEQAYNTHTNV